MWCANRQPTGTHCLGISRFCPLLLFLLSSHALPSAPFSRSSTCWLFSISVKDASQWCATRHLSWTASKHPRLLVHEECFATIVPYYAARNLTRRVFSRMWDVVKVSRRLCFAL